MSVVSDKYAALVDRLYDRTKKKQIEWTIPQGEAVDCKLGSHRIKLSSFRDEENEPFELLEITSDWGDVIESFNDMMLKGNSPSDAPFISYFDRMRELRHLALRQARGADKALDEILNWLDDDLEF